MIRDPSDAPATLDYHAAPGARPLHVWRVVACVILLLTGAIAFTAGSICLLFAFSLFRNSRADFGSFLLAGVLIGYGLVGIVFGGKQGQTARDAV